MDAQLYRLLIDRLDEDADLADHAELILAAIEGDATLEDFLGGDRQVGRRKAPAPEEVEPARAFISSIAVEGFRGIGPPAELGVSPGPGLTLVVGRNGSGKSSFAEALELLLTGDNKRWEGRAVVWKEGWRNLHHAKAVIESEFLVEGQPGVTRVVRGWEDDAGLDDSTAWVHPPGAAKVGLEALGWKAPLEMFRPFLSYNELGSMLDEGPSKLYDTLSSILGLGDLVALAESLRQARLSRERLHKDANATRLALMRKLRELDDERARACHEALDVSKRWNLDVVDDLVLGLEPEAGGGELELLQRMSSLVPPDVTKVKGAVEELEQAAEAVEALAGTDLDRAHETARLLQKALAFHASHGDGDCPVCGRAAALDAGWRHRSEEEVKRLLQEARAAEAARRDLREAIQRARRLLVGPPPFLLESERVGIDTRALRETWGKWEDGQQLEDPRALAAHLREKLGEVAPLVQAVGQAAIEELHQREDLWRPVAKELAEWLGSARRAQQGLDTVDGLKKAEKWVKEVSGDIRDERFEPIAEEALAVWELLRQQSNVELAKPVLTGTGTQRRVRLDVTVDGVDGAALGVMSQGELHSMALSLFLPRATMPESPFGFIVIDDPVQSMDPARVDGLARVLERVAETRQVIVFTHDDRLSEAVRRLGIAGKAIEVMRRADSVVELRPAFDPVTRYFGDAHVIVKTENLPEKVARRVVPGLCRSGIEAACIETYRRRRLRRGEPHAEVEETLARVTTTTMLASLALFDQLDRGGDVMSEINRRFGGREADAFKAAKAGVHHGYEDDLGRLVHYAALLGKGIHELG